MAKIPIVLSTDENYAPYCATTIASILKNSKKETELEFHILSAGLPKKTKEKFQELKKIKDCSLNFVTVNKDNFVDCPTSHHFTIESYFRFKLSSLLPNIEKVLYLDCDIIVLDDLGSLFEQDLDDYSTAMVLDASMKLPSTDNQKRLGIPQDGNYFNTGVALVNLKKWREKNAEEVLFKWTRKNREKIMWVDQDAINVVFHDSIKKLPEKYNIQMNHYRGKEMLGNLLNEMVVIHFCGAEKPWNRSGIYLSEYFWEYMKFSPFYSDRLRERYLLSYSEMQVSEVKFIKHLIRKYRPRKLLEVGIAAGSCLTFMLDEIKNDKKASIYGIDISKAYYRDSAKKTGWIASEAYPKLKDRLKIFTGGMAFQFLDEIGNDIDFCVLDTAHALPGELLDFLMILPYMKENSICILHDTNLQNLPVENGTIRVSESADKNNLQFLDDSFATGVLMSTLASEKIFPLEYLKNFVLPNIAAFKITPELKKNIKNVFYALSLPWKYNLSKNDKIIIANFIAKHYSKDDADYFFQIAGLMEKRIEKEEIKEKARIRDLSNFKATLESEKTERKLAEAQLRLKDAAFKKIETRLKAREAELKAVYTSREWKISSALRKIAKMIFPNKSLRRKALVSSWWLIVHPMRMAQKFSNKFFFREHEDVDDPALKIGKVQRVDYNSKKLVFVGHSFHKKTKSSLFFLDYLKQFFEVQIIWDESWRGENFADLSFVDNSYLCVIFWQSVPSAEVIRKLKNGNLIFVPMYDGTSQEREFWQTFKNFKIINFSKALHEKLKKWKFDSLYIQYFPEIGEFVPGSNDEVFFWQRITKININTLKKIFERDNLKIHIHKVVDPEHQFIQPSEEDEKKFHITYSTWFERREEMLELITRKGIYVAPRESEGIGMSFLEAMAMGKAVVAANSPTMNEYIEHNKTGYLFDLANPRKIDLSDLKEIQKNVYRFMKEGRYKWEKNKHQLIEFIKEYKSRTSGKSHMPMVNVITVSFNAKNDLEKTIKSVVKQDYLKINYIIIDGGSTDGTSEMIENYKDKIDHYVSERDEGIYDAMNKGLSYARDGFVNFLNAGDEFLSERSVSDLFCSLDREYDLVYGTIVIGNVTPEKLKNPQKNKSFTKNNLLFFNSAVLCHQAMFIRKEIVPLYDTSYKIKGDLNWYFDIVEKNPNLRYFKSNLAITNYKGEGISEKKFFLDVYETSKLIIKRFGVISFLRYRYHILVLRRIFGESKNRLMSIFHG